MDTHTSGLEASAYMFVLGLGLGMVMQVLVLAVQNAVDYQDLGVATAGATLFRSIGGSVGTAILGSIFTNRLSSELIASLPPGATRDFAGGLGHVNPAGLSRLPAAVHAAYIDAFTKALSVVFVVAAAVAAVAFLLSWALEQRPLRDTVAAGSGVGESFAIPKHTDSLAEAARGLTVLVGRERRKQFVERIAEGARVDLSAGACWLIVRLHDDAGADIAALCDAFEIPLAVGMAALSELEERGLLVAASLGDGGTPVRELAPAGAVIAEKLIAERRAILARLCEEWAPDEHADLAGLLTRLAHELARERPPEMAASP